MDLMKTASLVKPQSRPATLVDDLNEPVLALHTTDRLPGSVFDGLHQHAPFLVMLAN